MRPMPRRAPEPDNPMNRLTAGRAIADESLELGLRARELEPQHLRVDRQRMRPVEARVDSLLDDGPGLRRPLGDDVHGALEELAFG